MQWSPVQQEPEQVRVVSWEEALVAELPADWPQREGVAQWSPVQQESAVPWEKVPAAELPADWPQREEAAQRLLVQQVPEQPSVIPWKAHGLGRRVFPGLGRSEVPP